MALTSTVEREEVGLNGLTSDEARARRQRGQGNRVETSVSRSYLRILAESVFTVIHIILFGIAVFLAVLGLYGDAIVTGGLILINIAVGVIQESRAKRQLDRIALLTRPKAGVIRDGQEATIDPGEIVLGDLLIVRPGDQILVDGIVVRESSLSVDESLLTGESDLIQKSVEDRVFSGSYCMSGTGIYEADRVGADSLAQKLTDQARVFRSMKTPLQRNVSIVMRVMLVLMVLLGLQVLNSFLQIYSELPVKESAQAAAVIAALVPQGLVLMVTVTYAMAAVRMSRKGALIQRMNAVESTSHVSVLCMDKTGTLTTNRLLLKELIPLKSSADELRRSLADFASSTPTANHTIDALTVGLGQTGTARPLGEEAPFSSARKWSGLRYTDGDGAAYVLGAPDILSRAIRSDDDPSAGAAQWTQQGLRVLLFARDGRGGSLIGSDGEPALPGGLEPLGLVTFSDELRPEARETIASFADAGVSLKVISGDHPETVTVLARQAGFSEDSKMISGVDLDDYDDAALSAVVRDTTIFGRITPQQKERLVCALRSQGQYVAMIGDGVNDVLALKKANLAVAMLSGSPVTRNVADIVLLNDSFSSLPHAFREGQRILRGMLDVINLFLVRAGYVSLIILATSILGEAFPITPKQSALLATVTVGIPAFALAVWAKPGRTRKKVWISSAHFIIPAALTITVASMTVYMFFREISDDVVLARSALTTMTVMCGLLMVPFSEPPTRSWTGGDKLSGDWRPTILASVLLLGYFIVLILGPTRHFYELGILPYSTYLLLAFVAAGWAIWLRFMWRLRIDLRARVILRRRRARQRAHHAQTQATTPGAR